MMELLNAQPDYKMVFVVNTQLDMGRGKQCAQVAHAAVALSLDILSSEAYPNNSLKFHLWFSGGQKKIVLKGDNVAHLARLQEQSREAGLLNHLVSDAGHTQIAPGSKTVLAIFGTEHEVDNVTGSLRLL